MISLGFSGRYFPVCLPAGIFLRGGFFMTSDGAQRRHIACTARCLLCPPLLQAYHPVLHLQGLPGLFSRGFPIENRIPGQPCDWKAKGRSPCGCALLSLLNCFPVPSGPFDRRLFVLSASVFQNGAARHREKQHRLHCACARQKFMFSPCRRDKSP